MESLIKRNGVRFNITCRGPVLRSTTHFKDTSSTELTNMVTKARWTDITTQQGSGNESQTVNLVTILATVIGALILVAGTITVFIVFKRYRRAKEAERNDLEGIHEVSPATQVKGQGQIHPGNIINETVYVDTHAQPYESLNMYVNNPLAGETYQQLDSMYTNENIQTIETSNIQTNQQFKDNINEGINADTQSQPYESLNMYVNNKLTGETYQQLDSYRS